MRIESIINVIENIVNSKEREILSIIYKHYRPLFLNIWGGGLLAALQSSILSYLYWLLSCSLFKPFQHNMEFHETMDKTQKSAKLDIPLIIAMHESETGQGDSFHHHTPSALHSKLDFNYEIPAKCS